MHSRVSIVRKQFTEPANIVSRDFYVDDIITGINDLNNAIKLREDISLVFWIKKIQKIFKGIVDKYNNNKGINFDEESSIKTLSFSFPQLKPESRKNTIKRKLLSPILVSKSIFMQSLWQCKPHFRDDVLSKIISEKWNHLRKIHCFSPIEIMVRGFYDKSEQAYSAAIYIKSISSSDQISTNLLCSQTRD